MPWFLKMQLVAFLPLIVLNLYAGGKLARSIKAFSHWSVKRARWTVFGTLFLLNLLPVVSFLVYWTAGRRSMTAFSGENLWVEILLVYPFWSALVVLVQVSLVFVLWDAIGGIGRLFRSFDRDIWKRRTHVVTVWVWIVMGVYSVATIVVETSSARIVRLQVILPGAAEHLDGLRILHISDVQGDGRTTEAKISRFVEQARELDPDLILNSGDMVTNGTQYIASTARIIGAMASRYGHVAAVGDHDIFSNKAMSIAAMRDNGIIVADDTTFTHSVGRSTIGLTLITYTYRQRPPAEVVDSLLSANGEAFKVLLIHQPNRELVERAASHGYHLILAGHTHGGGIAFGLPGLGVVSPASFESPYVSGEYRIGETILNVTNGLGFTLAPIRFHAPLEMTLIVLRAKKRTSNEDSGP